MSEMSPSQSAVATARLTRVSSVMTGTESTTTSARICIERRVSVSLEARPVVDAVAGSPALTETSAGAVLAPFQPIRLSIATRSSPTVRSDVWWSLDPEHGGPVERLGL